MKLSKFQVARLSEILTMPDSTKTDQDAIVAAVQQLVLRPVRSGKMPTERSQITRLSMFKTHLSKGGLADTIASRLRPNPAMLAKILAQNSERAAAKREYIVTPEFLDLIKHWDNSDNPYHLYSFLAITGGRRTVETLNAAFSLKGGMIQTRELTKKGKLHKGELCSFVTLIPAARWLEQINKLRGIVSAYKENFQANINRYLKRTLKDPSFHAHMFRAMYARIAHRFYNPERMNLPGFIQKVLCHSSFNAALAYTAINIDRITENPFA